VGARVDCFPTGAAFPKWPEGRHPHCHFRGLLGLYSRYSPPDRSAAQGDFVTRLQPFRLSGRAARQLPDQSTTFWVDSSSTSVSRLRGARPTRDIAFFFGSGTNQVRGGCDSGRAPTRSSSPRTLPRRHARNPCSLKNNDHLSLTRIKG
jgi:hypothetical protein